MYTDIHYTDYTLQLLLCHPIVCCLLILSAFKAAIVKGFATCRGATLGVAGACVLGQEIPEVGAICPQKIAQMRHVLVKGRVCRCL